MKETVAFVFARGGSKGIPRKNVRDFCGKPLIAHTIDLARRMPEVREVILSTDDPEIAAIGRQCGASVPFSRPAELSGDRAPEWLAWQHAIRHVLEVMGVQFDCFLSLPPTSPLREEEDVRACLNRYCGGGADLVVGVTESSSNPYFNMLVLDSSGSASLAIPPEGKVFRRQDAPQVLDIAPCAYVSSPQFILHNSGLFDGVLKTVTIPPERAVDIDTEVDFEFAEFLYDRKKLKSSS